MRLLSRSNATQGWSGKDLCEVAQSPGFEPRRAVLETAMLPLHQDHRCHLCVSVATSTYLDPAGAVVLV